ncbi:MAG: ferritin family protein [Candidatus Omnitrophica bacterium]|nr:ferritin family protein [Candidatus Omnitrophota bacterium]
MAEGKIHLRQILQMGVMVEKRGEEFYKGLADRPGDTKTRELYRRLADAETRHKEFIEKTLAEWKPIALDAASMRVFDQETRFRGIFASPPPPDSSEEDAAKYAVAQEWKMVDFYRFFENDFPDAWRAMKLQELVEEERRHVKAIVAAYPQLKDLTAMA